MKNVRGEERLIQGFWGKTEGKIPLERTMEKNEMGGGCRM